MTDTLLDKAFFYFGLTCIGLGIICIGLTLPFPSQEALDNGATQQHSAITQRPIK